MRLSTLILPIYSWPDARTIWTRAEQLGFHCAYTYDHLSWRSFRDKPWYATIPTLTAAATATETIRLGTMVTNPNFRHPVTLAKDLMTLEEISHGRITLGIGAGTGGFDATVLGNPPWSRRERAEHFDEFVPLLSQLLKHDATTQTRRSPSPFSNPRAASGLPLPDSFPNRIFRWLHHIHPIHCHHIPATLIDLAVADESHRVAGDESPKNCSTALA